MALYQPVFAIPDVRSGLGLGVVDATQDMKISWRITGSSAMTSFSVTIYTNNAASTQKYTTGQITTGCPAYGTTSTGEIQFFSYTIPAAALSAAGITNGNEYKIIIQQWWSVSDSVTQTSASVFITRAAPTLSISTIGTGGVIGTRYYTFTGNYSQAQGDTLNWFRWRIAYADNTDDPFFDTENISGTMDISAYYDGFFDDTDYAIRLTCQTESGVEADTGWVSFSASYTTSTADGKLSAGCVGGTDAIKVSWSIGYIPGEATGPYTITQSGDRYYLNLPTGSSVEWANVDATPMAFAEPWSIVYQGQLGATDATLFTIGQSGGNITLTYNFSAKTLVLKKGISALFTYTDVINSPSVTAILTPDAIRIRLSYYGGGLYPSDSLYPSATLYPSADDQKQNEKQSSYITYTQEPISSVSVGGYQSCQFVEVINGTPSASVISAAYNFGTYVPVFSENDYMLVDFSDGINAGSLNIGGDTITGFALYRRQNDTGELIKIAETDSLTQVIYDYGARSQQGLYTYYLFPIGATTYITAAFPSGGVCPVWWNWTLVECAATSNPKIFNVLSAYRFRLNVESGAVSNNNSPNVLKNFTPYPKVQLAPQNYKSGSLSALLGAVDWSGEQPEYIDTLAWRDALYALSTSQNPLFLKNRKGDLIRIRLSGPIVMATADNTKEQMQTVTLPWVEVGSAEGVSLYSSSYAGVQSPEGQSKAQNFVIADDATLDDPAELRIAKTAIGPNGLVVGDAEFTVQGSKLIAPPGMVI